ncbi:hypothetical protein K4K49_003284 [Colletotrichum sp. SAR 10_70]|nr:hypothetical protein K4K50_004058 [Colletotrichum sp. SAR 10_71]KAI8172885.1 hypothetical protein K4K49_003284 [Colletotrichum sp. SAR 10_70]
MLYGGFAESGHSDVDHGWTVDLPEDRQQPMEMMLNIVHGAFEKVPEKIELTELYTFLVVTEKYDATNITRPWAKGWMEGVKTSMQNPLLLGVAYELGDYQTFNAMAMKIATECHLDHEEDLVFGFAGENRESYTYKLKNLDCLIPDGLLDDAASIRKTLLIAMLDPYLNLYGALKGGDRCMSSPGDPSGGKRCDSLLLGSLIKSFATQNLDLTANDPVKAYRGKTLFIDRLLLIIMDDSENSTSEPDKKRPKLETTGPTTPVILEEFGDLQLRVGSDHTDQPAIFLVCSRTVARSSPVLKRMLYGGFAESLSAQAKKENWVVDLPDDRPDSFKIFLHVIHGHFDRVPSKIAIDSLYLLLVLLDKYDSIGLIRPWAKPWLKGIKSSGALPLALYIAWNLGHKETFQSKMTTIIQGSFIDEQGSLSYEQECRSKETGALSVHHIKLAADLDNWGPPDALDTIREMRHKLVSIQFESYIQLYKSLISEQGRCRYRARVKPHLLEAGMRCDSVALGSLIRECSLQGIDIMAQDPVEAYRGTVPQLKDKLAALKIFVGESNDKTDHFGCTRNLKKYRDDLSADNERKTAEALVLKPQYQARMEAQAKKTGI